MHIHIWRLYLWTVIIVRKRKSTASLGQQRTEREEGSGLVGAPSLLLASRILEFSSLSDLSIPWQGRLTQEPGFRWLPQILYREGTLLLFSIENVSITRFIYCTGFVKSRWWSAAIRQFLWAQRVGAQGMTEIWLSFSLFLKTTGKKKKAPARREKTLVSFTHDVCAKRMESICATGIQVGCI